MGVIRCPNDVKVYTGPLCSSYFDGQTHYYYYYFIIIIIFIIHSLPVTEGLQSKSNNNLVFNFN